MWPAIRNVIFGFMAVFCGLIGIFWLWFGVTYALRPLTNFEEVGWQVLRESAARPFWGYTAVALVWFLLAAALAWLQWQRR